MWNVSIAEDFSVIVQISEDIKDAVIYLDAGCTESFQLLGAFPLLLELGVHAVCSLENMSPLDVVRAFYIMFNYLNLVLNY